MVRHCPARCFLDFGTVVTRICVLCQEKNISRAQKRKKGKNNVHGALKRSSSWHGACWFVVTVVGIHWRHYCRSGSGGSSSRVRLKYAYFVKIKTLVEHKKEKKRKNNVHGA